MNTTNQKQPYEGSGAQRMELWAHDIVGTWIYDDILVQTKQHKEPGDGPAFVTTYCVGKSNEGVHKLVGVFTTRTSDEAQALHERVVESGKVLLFMRLIGGGHDGLDAACEKLLEERTGIKPGCKFGPVFEQAQR